MSIKDSMTAVNLRRTTDLVCESFVDRDHPPCEHLPYNVVSLFEFREQVKSNRVNEHAEVNANIDE